ncbi:hypothetical protein M1523_04405 [Patescibacteria group bacterium]|nr:hypothetical protein [Patescibacteria group bacterium]MCL5091536.1 hypothetical protein [Patescibacteria group bacterium]
MKTQSYLFLVFLLVVLVFILGVRYGQQVERTDRVPTPVTSRAPAPTIALDTKTYIHQGCGVSFIYPAWWHNEVTSSRSASFAFAGQTVMSVICDKTNLPAPIGTNPTEWRKKDPKTGLTVTVKVNDGQKNWLRLVGATLEFISPTP